jgi:hypothetical protein
VSSAVATSSAGISCDSYLRQAACLRRKALGSANACAIARHAYAPPGMSLKSSDDRRDAGSNI